MKTNCQGEFREGYDGAPSTPNPYLYSSPAWEAFELGRYMHQTGRPVDAVRPSRGDTWRTGRGLLFRLHYSGKGQFHFTREE